MARQLRPDEEYCPTPGCGKILKKSTVYCSKCRTTLEAGWANPKPTKPVRSRFPIGIVLGVFAILLIAAGIISGIGIGRSSQEAEQPAATNIPQGTGASAPAPTPEQPITLPPVVQVMSDIELKDGPDEKYNGNGIVLSQGLLVWAKERDADTTWLRVCTSSTNCTTAAGWVNISKLTVEASILHDSISRLPVADTSSIPPLPSATPEPTVEPTFTPTAEATNAAASNPTSAPEATKPSTPVPTRRPATSSISPFAALRYYTGHPGKVADPPSSGIGVTIYSTSKRWDNMTVCVGNNDRSYNHCLPYSGTAVTFTPPKPDSYVVALFNFTLKEGEQQLSQAIWVDTTQGSFNVDFGDGQRQ